MQLPPVETSPPVAIMATSEKVEVDGTTSSSKTSNINDKMIPMWSQR
jgi:hypothetical protein